MKVYKNGEMLFDNCKVAKTFVQKLRGKFLINNPLLLLKCNAVHTIFMSDKLDIIFLNKNNKVIKFYEGVSPRCIIFPVFGAESALELNAGNLKSAKIKLGDILNFEE